MAASGDDYEDDVYEDGYSKKYRYRPPDNAPPARRYAEVKVSYFSIVAYGEGHPLCAFLDDQGKKQKNVGTQS
jgi:hypothetical protein